MNGPDAKALRGHRAWHRRLVEPEVLVWLILGALVLFCVAATPLFLEPENLGNVFLVQPIGLGLAALGQAMVVISGGIDLSVGSVISLLSSLAAGLYRAQPGLHPAVVALFLIVLGAAAGSLNGLIVVRLRVPPFMATLATMSLFQGAVLFYAPRTIGGIPASYRFISDGRIEGIPFSILLFAVVILACMYLLRRNRLGRHFYAVGSDPYVSQISGIPVQRVRFLAYLACGILVGIAALFMTSRFGGGGPKVGVGYELDSITAVVIGGVSLAGGSGSLIGTIAGVLIIGVFYNAMNLLSVNAYFQIVLKGLVLILAVSFYAKRRAGR
jgi:ribose/xylose/arabinose/galactoside ABC-type transport system permease subunit